MISFSFGKKEETFLVLDIGSEAIKGAVFEKKEKEIKVLSLALEYFDRYGVFEGRDFEHEVLEKALLKALNSLLSRSGKMRSGNIGRIVLTLSPEILKYGVETGFFKRGSVSKIITEKEEKEIKEKALKSIKVKISKSFFDNFGILREDLVFLNHEILNIEIDGYQVPGLKGYKGENLEFKVSAIFALKERLEKIVKTVKSLVKKKSRESEILHLTQGFSYFLNNIDNGIFLDFGGDTTQVYLLQKGKLENSEELKTGGRDVSKVFSEKLGLLEAEARVFKEKYANGELSHESDFKAREILKPCFDAWFKELQLCLEGFGKGKLLPSKFYFFGGSSVLPELKGIKDAVKQGMYFSSEPEISYLTPKDLFSLKPDFKLDFKEVNKTFENNPQFTPLFLIFYAATQKNN